MNIGAPEVLGLAAGGVFLLALFVWFVVLVVRSGPKCPACYGRVDRRASVCPHCRADLAAGVA